MYFDTYRIHRLPVPFLHMDTYKIAKRMAQINRLSKIVKKGNKWCVKSENNPDWNGGCFDTKEEAQKRLREVEYFKHKK